MNMWILKKKKSLHLARMFNQNDISTLAKSHTIFQEFLKRGLRDLKRNTLPLRFTDLNEICGY